MDLFNLMDIWYNSEERTGEDERLIFQMFEPFSAKDAGLMSVLQLAYIGDSVWELFVRNHLVRKGLNVHHMHSECIRHVNAKAQASYLGMLSDCLTPEETELVRRGRNAHAHHPVPKNQNPEDRNFTAQKVEDYAYHENVTLPCSGGLLISALGICEHIGNPIIEYGENQFQPDLYRLY